MKTRLWIPSFLMLVVTGCGNSHPPSQSKTSLPAQVVQFSNEKNLANVTLTPEAERRLGIKTQPVELKSVTCQRIYNGEILTPPGQTITVSAPLGGHYQESS